MPPVPLSWAGGSETPCSSATIGCRKKDSLSTPMQAWVGDALVPERRLVNAAYGFTPAEVALVWATAPPRMPVGRGGVIVASAACRQDASVPALALPGGDLGRPDLVHFCGSGAGGNGDRDGLSRP